MTEKNYIYNLMFNNCGNLNLMHSEAAMKAARMTIATAQFHGVESHLIDARQAKELVPALNISEDITFPVMVLSCEFSANTKVDDKKKARHAKP